MEQRNKEGNGRPDKTAFERGRDYTRDEACVKPGAPRRQRAGRPPRQGEFKLTHHFLTATELAEEFLHRGRQ
ncbi:MAG TPA: hypothetical protein VFR03_00535, partial [Thermoanaerobaculia bacterium]|nr:hypothetical protein [Thermoanaerobaculia bacterium]